MQTIGKSLCILKKRKRVYMKRVIFFLLLGNLLFANECLQPRDVKLVEVVGNNKKDSFHAEEIDLILETKEGKQLKTITIYRDETFKRSIVYKDLNFDGVDELLVDASSSKEQPTYYVFSLKCQELVTFMPAVLYDYKLDTTNRTLYNSFGDRGDALFKLENNKYYAVEGHQRLSRDVVQFLKLDKNQKIIFSSYTLKGKETPLPMIAESYWSLDKRKRSAKFYELYEKILHDQNKTTPLSVQGYDGYKSYRVRKNNKMIANLGRNSTLEEVTEIANSISKESFNSYRGKGASLFSKSLCFDNVELLEKLRKKGATLKTGHLRTAQECGARKVLKYLIDKNVVVDYSRYNVVQHAIDAGDLESIKVLFSNHKELNREIFPLFKTIGYAIKDEHKKEEFLNYFFTKKIDVNLLYDEKKNTLLRDAVCENDKVMARFFLEHGADTTITYPDYSGRQKSIFNCAEDVNMMKLLAKYGAKPLASDLEKNIRKGKEAEVEFLLAEGTEISKDVLKKVFERKNKTLLPLFEKYNSVKLTQEEVNSLYSNACSGKNSKAIERLIAMGHPPKTAKRAIFSCLVYASDEKEEEFFNFLLTQDVDVNFTPKEGVVKGYNLLQRVVYQNYGLKMKAVHRRRLEKLIAKGIDVNYHHSKNGHTVMTQLLEKGYVDTAKYVYAHSDVNVSLVNTLLHYAVADAGLLKEILEKMKHEHILKDFINKKDFYSKTALHYAAAYDNDSVKVLLEYGASNIRVDHRKATAFAYVTNRQNYDLLKQATNSYSKFRAECNVLVGLEGKKEYQPSCLEVAKKESMEDMKVYYLFLGGDFSSFENMSIEQTAECQFNTYRHLAFYWVYKKDFKKAKAFFKAFTIHGMSSHSLNYIHFKKLFFEEIDIFRNLYGETFANDAERVLKEVDDYFVRGEENE